MTMPPAALKPHIRRGHGKTVILVSFRSESDKPAAEAVLADTLTALGAPVLVERRYLPIKYGGCSSRNERDKTFCLYCGSEGAVSASWAAS